MRPLNLLSFFPNDYEILKLVDLFNFESHSLVQFYHRNLAYIITIYILILGIYIYKREMTHLFLPLKIFLFFLVLQGLLGILTLISGLNIYLASAHQIVGVLLVLSAINLYYSNAK